MNISKAVIPAAGIGTRCLPFSKAVPKEMIPLLEKPAIQWIVEEGIASGIQEFTIITNSDKRAIRDHFSPHQKLEAFLKEKNSEDLLKELNVIINTTQFNYVLQKEPRGLGDAVFMARDTIGDNYFGLFLPDDILIGKRPAMEQLITLAQEYNTSIIAVQEIPDEQISSHGIIAIKKQKTSHLFEVAQLIEKPQLEHAPSNFAIIGRYVLSPRIFDSLAHVTPGAKGEVQLTDAIAHMMENGEKILAYNLQMTRFDIGNTLGWVKANHHFACNDPRFAAYLQ